MTANADDVYDDINGNGLGHDDADVEDGYDDGM